jgi:hypothetical protein
VRAGGWRKVPELFYSRCSCRGAARILAAGTIADHSALATGSESQAKNRGKEVRELAQEQIGRDRRRERTIEPVARVCEVWIPFPANLFKRTRDMQKAFTYTTTLETQANAKKTLKARLINT